METMDVNEFWSGRSVFVTGGTGFIGSWLVKRLVELQAEVTVLVMDAEPQSELYRSHTIDRVHVVNGRLEDLNTLERAISHFDTETVFHLGAQTIVPIAHHAPWPTFEANVRGTYNLLEACRRHQQIVRRVVVASSDKAYGERSEPYREAMDLQAKHPYEVSKACGELLARAYTETYEIPIAIARCGNVYGGGDLNWSRIVPGTIRAFLANQRPQIRSNGRLIRDYFYVQDAVSAYLLLGEQLQRPEVQGQAFNFSTETPCAVLDMVAAIQRAMGCETIEPEILDRAEGEIPTQALSARKAREQLGWRPRWSLEEGLAETIAWYRAFFSSAEARL